jgi:hypothetical protein
LARPEKDGNSTWRKIKSIAAKAPPTKIYGNKKPGTLAGLFYICKTYFP